MTSFNMHAIDTRNALAAFEASGAKMPKSLAVAVKQRDNIGQYITTVQDKANGLSAIVAQQAMTGVLDADAISEATTCKALLSSGALMQLDSTKDTVIASALRANVDDCLAALDEAVKSHAATLADCARVISADSLDDHAAILTGGAQSAAAYARAVEAVEAVRRIANAAVLLGEFMSVRGVQVQATRWADVPASVLAEHYASNLHIDDPWLCARNGWAIHVKSTSELEAFNAEVRDLEDENARKAAERGQRAFFGN